MPIAYGNDYVIVLNKVPLQEQIDAWQKLKVGWDVVLGDEIAHEFVHALGKKGHGPAGFIDSEKMIAGETYSPQGAEYVVKQLGFKTR